MPLPDNEQMEWPPAACKKVNDNFRIWEAWYSGSREKLASVYEGVLSTFNDPKGYQNVKGGVAYLEKERYFWGTSPSFGSNTLRPHRLHIPLAGDIAATSADLLFGEAPRGRSDADEPAPATPADKGVKKAPSATQTFLDMLVDEGGWHPAMLEAGEIAASHSGVYLRLGWDKEIAAHPLLSAITPDHAVPEWRSGHLIAVTFWTILEREDGREGKVLRHLERHEMAGTGQSRQGRILHGLYEGTDDRLGRRIDVGGHEVTKVFADLPFTEDLAKWDTTGCTGLSVEFMHNIRPAKTLSGTEFGRPDYDGIEGDMDSLDETWSSLMRDLRNGKGRVVIPESMIHDLGPGKGGLYDPEQEFYAPVQAMGRNDGALSLEVIQFEIRTTEHLEMAKELVCVCVEGAGYNAQTFGKANEVTAATATEIQARQSKTNKTRARKIGYARPVQSRLYSRAIEMATAKLDAKGLLAGPVRVTWPDGIPDDPESTARSLQMLHAAESISLYMKVKAREPGWEDWEIRDEVDRIREDQRLQMQIQTPPGPPGQGSTGFDMDGNKKTEPGTTPDKGQESKTE